MAIKKRYLILCALTFVGYSLAGLSGLQFVRPVAVWPGRLLVNHPTGFLLLGLAIMGIFVGVVFHIRRGGMRVLMAYLKVKVAILAGLVLTALVWHGLGVFKTWGVMARIESDGIMSELPVDGDAPADADNAAHWFLKAQDALKDVEGTIMLEKRGKVGLSTALSEAIEDMADGVRGGKDLPKIIKIVRGNGEAVRLAIRGESRSKIYWGVGFNGDDWEALYNIEVPTYRGVMQLARVLVLQAALDAQQGKRAAAGKKLRTGLALAQAMAKEPLLISQMVAVGVYRTTLRGADIVFRKSRGLEKMSGWEQYLDPAMMVSNFRLAVKTEMIVWPMSITQSDRGWQNLKQGYSRKWERVWFFFYRPFVYYDLASGMQYRFKMADMYGRPYGTYDKELSKAIEEHEKRSMRLSRMWFPRFDDLRRKVIVNVARMHIANAAIRLRKSKTGGLKWLDGVKDPFTGKPYVVRNSKGGVTVYSFGPDGKDDNGARYDRSTKKGDISRYVALP